MAQPQAPGKRAQGFTGALTATTEVACRSTTYTEQTSGAQRSLKSASANDAAAGTGARIVRVWYYTLDSSGNIAGPFHEDVTLNGTVAVPTVNTNIALIEKMEVISAGSGGVAAGAISLYTDNAGVGSVIWSIAASARQTFGAHHYVPNGNTCNLLEVIAGSTAPAVADYPLVNLRYQQYQVASGLAELEHVLLEPTLVSGSLGTLRLPINPPLPVAGPARIVAYVAPGSSTSQVEHVAFTFFEQ